VPPARSDGLGALVAGSVPVAAALLVTAPVAVGGAFAVRHSPWLGVVAVALAAAVGVGVSWHVSRRLGGITGDTLGACCELGTLLAWTLLAL
jgi:adenosylcobinamide-GDP ribazoletransferase